MAPPNPPRRPPPLSDGRPVREQGPKPGGNPNPLRPPTRHEDEPPLTPHRELVHVDDRPAQPESVPAPPSRKDSPPGGIRIEGRGFRLTMPVAALVAVITALGGWFTSKAVSKGESAEVSDVLTELRSVHKDVKDLSGDVADVRAEQRKSRSNDAKILNYTEDSVTPLVASMRKLGVKLEYDGKSDPARDVEFHPPPGPGSTAPPIQPKATLPERPSL